MRSSLALHTVAFLRFYLRNRLILAFNAVVVLIWTLGLVPLFLFESTGSRFDILKALSAQTHGVVWFATAGLGLFAIWSHVRQRNTSLIFTRPIRPEAWTAAAFVSALIVAFGGHALATLVIYVLSVVWEVPFQSGFVWAAVDGMFESVIIVSALTALATAVHPVVAVASFALFNESTFFQLDTMLLGYIEAGSAGWPSRAAEAVVRWLHLGVPMLDPFAAQTESVMSTLRVVRADWWYLAGTGAYAALIFLVSFLLADTLLRRRAAV